MSARGPAERALERVGHDRVAPLSACRGSQAQAAIEAAEGRRLQHDGPRPGPLEQAFVLLLGQPLQ